MRSYEFVVKTLFLCIFAIGGVKLAAIGESDAYQSLAPAQGLYNSSDDVIVLNANNFKTSVNASATGWLVEFYNSWCGFCHRFAPTWKELARDVSGWRDVVKVAAIDCADDDNTPICREYEIMHYPMLKYFSVMASPTSMGIEVEKGKDVYAIRHNLIDRLRKEQQDGRGSTWPNIVPYRSGDVKNLWRNVPETVKHYFLVFEKPDSYLGAEVILDLHKVEGVRIRSVTSDNEPLGLMINVNKFPSLVVLGRGDSHKILPVKTPAREVFRGAILDFLKTSGSNLTTSEEASSPGSTSSTTSSPNLRPDSTREQDPLEGSKSSPTEDDLFWLDLEMALRYSLFHEVPMTKSIHGEKMQALKNYLSVLIKYFPSNYNILPFLDLLLEKLKDLEEVSGREFSRMARLAEEEVKPVFSGVKKWMACVPVGGNSRGYPCGLWTMFHTLTVRLNDGFGKGPSRDPKEVLGAIHGYVKNFFGCADCSRHFLEMAARKGLFQVGNRTEGVLWLWRAHNEVNRRLSSEESKDPGRMKVQYPLDIHCPRCRFDNRTWNEVEVLGYLKRKYSTINMAEVELPSLLLEDISSPRQERLVAVNEDKGVTRKKIGWDFTIFDISICVMLYIASAAILVLVCIKFAVKRTYKKKIHVHHLFGRV
ncbi:sulfhydryl oxidase 1 [Orussus abietinus]|uniref:sulfhydryl oxidase 1 n=1 Tax=Orussus abietinus TaxID=222816 RepID=UPI0006267E47|nr:sulfhydryl oxidase 1 [Orussus abietinus]